MRAIVSLVALLAPAPAQAAGLPVYMSDRFEAVAKKLAVEVALAALEKACPKQTEAFCRPILAALVDAFRAARIGDGASVKDALDDFFLQVAVNVPLHFLLEEIAQRSGEAGLEKSMRMLMPCIAGVWGE